MSPTGPGVKELGSGVGRLADQFLHLHCLLNTCEPVRYRRRIRRKPIERYTHPSRVHHVHCQRLVISLRYRLGMVEEELSGHEIQGERGDLGYMFVNLLTIRLNFGAGPPYVKKGICL